MVIEWKTARRPKHSVRDLYDNPIQAAAYLGAYNYTHRKAQVRVSHRQVLLRTAVLLLETMMYPSLYSQTSIYWEGPGGFRG